MGLPWVPATEGLLSLSTLNLQRAGGVGGGFGSGTLGPFHTGEGGTGDIKLALCQWGSVGRGPSHPTPLHSGLLTTLTWHEPHVERYQALAVVDSSVGPMCSGQPLSLGTGGVSKQELQKCGHGLPPPGKQPPVVPWGGGGGVSFSPPHRLHSREPSSGPRWGGASAHYAGHSGGYLALVKLVHSLCDPITVIQPHHAGKPGDEASIPWGRKRSGCCPRSPSPPTCSLGCREACPGSLMPLNVGQMGMSGQALQLWGSWAPGREGPVAALTVILPRPLGAWGVVSPPRPWAPT